MLILTLMMSLSVFSQNVTKDSTAIQLRKPIARLVIKDLIKGDGAHQEVALFTRSFVSNRTESIS